MRTVYAILGVLTLSAAPLAMAMAEGVPLPSPRPETVPPARADHDELAKRNRESVAVIIGNRNYGKGLPAVVYADNDAASVKRYVIDVLGYREGNVIDLRDATQAEMLSVFGNAQEHRGKLWSWIRDDRSDVLVYYSGHGMPGLHDRRGYLVPVDADPATPEINGYGLDLLLANLAKLNTRSTTVLLDACFSGNSAGGWLIPSASPVYVKTAAPPQIGEMTVITAAQGDQLASWDHEAKLGLFTRYLLDGLYGAADNGPGGNNDGEITLGEIRSHLDDTMSYAARRQFRRVQTASVYGDPRTSVTTVSTRSFALPANRPEARPASRPAPPPPSSTPSARQQMSQPKPIVERTPFTQRKIASVVSVFHRPGRDPASVRAFLMKHRDDIAATLVQHYAGASGQNDGPALNILDMRVVAIREHGFDLYVSHSNRREQESPYVLFRLRVMSNQLVVEKMWQ